MVAGGGGGDEAWGDISFRMGDPSTCLHVDENLKERVKPMKEKKG